MESCHLFNNAVDGLIQRVPYFGTSQIEKNRHCLSHTYPQCKITQDQSHAHIISSQVNRVFNNDTAISMISC